MLMMVPNANHFNKKIIRIHRDNLLAESFQQISDASSESLQHGISVEFIDEQGVGDGVTREWFELVSNEIFISKEVQVEEEVEVEVEEVEVEEEVEVVHPFHVPCSDFTRRFSPNPIFVEWEQFEFAGRLMGLSLIHNMQLNVFLDSAFFLHLAGVVICLEDIKETEPELHKTLKSMLEGHGLEDLTFEIDIQTGKNVYSLEELYQVGIRIEDWKNHTIYGGEGYGYQATDKQILWFWEVVEGMSKEQQMNLLKFWTSTSYLPHGGIGGLSRKLQILKIEQEYPTSATCLYSLKLPPYDTFENMKFWLEFVAEEENCRGFGMQ
ncbi:hypothetical protein F2Q69_00063289 [Brassica cretica]|uniref:HECT-type E3 ubiquitin transferase n=1 Tax=Brassica cretica TaxID=69181 RepID=A0A8S9RLS0_BRACR|nr:hypothetical protein F2Q69_00063289 [Brassica cretica]